MSYTLAIKIVGNQIRSQRLVCRILAKQTDSHLTERSLALLSSNFLSHAGSWS